MKLLDAINTEPRQRIRHTLPDGSLLILSLRYGPAVRMWFLDVEWKEFSMKGIRLCLSLNLLQQYSNLIPFGIGLNAPQGVEPRLASDFSSGRVKLFVLNKREVAAITNAYEVAEL